MTQLKIFVSKNRVDNNMYHYFSEIIDIEEIKETNEEILRNLEKIKIKQMKNKIKNKIIVVNIDKPTILKANIFKYIGKIEKPNQKICELISNNIKIKILFRVELRL